jgi:hypothetical protein
MSRFMDAVDDFVLGPLNLLDWLEGVGYALFYRDFGYELSIPRSDKGGKFSQNEMREILSTYGVTTYGRRFDSQNMYIRVKKRQARWAEYVLLHAGVELLNPAFDHRNAGYAANHAPGWMPRPWSTDTPKSDVAGSSDSRQKQESEQIKSKGLLAWLDSL